ncbi:helix-turn-helix domain-containing protein [Pontibacter ruber]|uniref:Helix-turn-helix domain-containing protein n=1 Tax=Pontibacter ruber TaxID=1343895 RepID=A0ABW5CTQ5_9BACT|nr:helix-turn-helix domain-containing protein [Pontibacter ruber]
MEEVYVFVDEFGTNHLDVEKQGNTSHFIYSALAIKGENINAARKIREKIATIYFQSGIIKSSRIKNNEAGFNKRLNILKELRELDFLVLSLVVDKKQINSDGLKIKESFYKYFQNLLLGNFTKAFKKFHIYADNIGYPEFRISLTNYINENLVQRNLFEQDRYYQLADDKTEEPLLQLADFISGCVGKIYCASHSHVRSNELLDLISDKLNVIHFPYQSYNYISSSQPDKDLDSKIASIAVDETTAFLNNFSNRQNLEAYEILSYLLQIFKVSPNKLVETHELVERLNRFSIDISKEQIRQHISYLRDQGIIITSIKGKSGYKIPNQLEDIKNFYNRYLDNIVPMLKRVSASNKLLQLRTLNEINVLHNNQEFHFLYKMIEAVDLQKN